MDDGAATSQIERNREEAKRYGQIGLRCMLADRLLDFTYIASFAWFMARPLDQLLLDHEWVSASGRLALLYLVMTIGHVLVSLPLSYYASFLVEHQFGLSNQSRVRWLTQYAKSMLVAVILNMMMVQLLFATIWYTGAWWWIVAACGSFVVMAILGRLAPILILPLLYKIERFQHEDLERRFAELTRGTGLSIEGVYRMNMSQDTVKANAMLAGLGGTRRVIIGDTLLEQFHPEEIEVVFAHEVGHHVHRHIHKLMLLMFVGVGGSFFICDRIFQAVAPGVDYHNLPVWSLPSLFVLFNLIGMLAEPIQNGVSRHFERQADRYALDKTANPAAFRSAFEKLATLNKADKEPHPLEVFLFHSHPPIEERLAQCRG